MAGITISGGMIFTGGVAVGDGGGPGPGPGPGPSPASAGSLYSWGSAAYGQLGQNSIINKSSPTQVGADSTWLVMASSYTTVAVKSDGTLWAWGEGDSGELGINTVGNRSSPVQIGSDTNWAFATQSNTGAATGAACFAIKSDGTLWAWGKNTDDTWLGVSAGNKSSPVQVGSSTWSTVASGLNWTIGIQTDGTLWGWGSPFNGSLPLDGAGGGYISVPTAIGSDTNWSQVKGGPFWTGLALKTNGTLWSWGYNNWGQLGNNSGVNASSPVQIGAGTNWASIGASQSSSFAINTAGELYSWGRNNNGQLGDGLRGSTLAKSSPGQVGALTNWARISSGDIGTKLAVKTDGTLWSWGVAPIGDDTAIPRSSPIQIGSGTGWQNVATGTGVSMAIST